MPNLAAAGIDPKSIDTILISHFHPDHINGIKDKDDKIVFPNAEINVPEPEWAFWMDDAKMNAAPDGMKPAFRNVRRIFGDLKDVKRLRARQGARARHHVDRRLWPHAGPHGVRDRVGQSVDAVPERHHQQSVAVRAQSRLAGRSSTWTARWRSENRKKLLERAVVDRMLVQGYHFPFPASGHIVKTSATTYDLAPVLWQPSL